MTRVVAILSQKGGVGKTSLVQNLSAELARLGQRILMVDFDPQANLTDGWGLDPGDDRPTIYHVMAGQTEARTARVTMREGLDLLTASLDLAGADPHFAGEIDRYYKLRRAVKQIEDEYDFVFIDCPPALGFYTNSALMAATEILIPLQVQAYAYKALDQLLAIVVKARDLNPTLRLSGIVLTMYDQRNRLTGSVEDAARERFKELVFQTAIPVNVRIAEAPLAGQPVGEVEEQSRGAQAYRALAQEVLQRG
jgi:chromosome partitioning protein